MIDETQQDSWYGEETATFGDRLAAARDAAGLTQKELAQKMGIKTSTLRNWEDDLSEPRAQRLSIFAGVLGVSLSWLLTGEGEGVAAPDEEEPVSADLAALLVDLRTTRAQIARSNDQLAQIEKRLRGMMKS